ncbi:hypothetical protein Ciccas_006925 [Cichlidogyrus casuarinus]|uniref:Tubulin polymerization-promoting protein family member 2 n=1 Tax=Cichlidogyrus casuarinus TaxID=1844966 RepID=A0ABD2Q893_9PLAT
MDQSVFVAFCDASKRGSNTATTKTLKKILVDSKILDKNFSMNSVDIEFSKYLGKTQNKTKAVNSVEFNTFVNDYLIPVYAKDTKKSLDDATEFIRNALAKCGGPSAVGTTQFSKDDATARMTDVSKYTGAHRERFDAETGQGLGKAGRTDELNTDGFVDGFKGKGTYDTTH